MPHNIDLHSATGALGGGALTKVNPGEQVVLRWKATRPGVFIYHCAPEGMIPWHVVSGMHGTDPGLAAVLLLHFPIGGFYLYHLHANGLIMPWDWIIGIVYLAAFMFLGVAKATYSWLADRNSPYPFADEEMRRFGVLERRGSRLSGNQIAR